MRVLSMLLLTVRNVHVPVLQSQKQRQTRWVQTPILNLYYDTDLICMNGLCSKIQHPA